MTAVRVGNFKAFEDVQRLPLKPITLVYGPNSAGKSTLVQALALAHQAQFGAGPNGRPSLNIHHTLLGGSAIDLGGFRQYVHRGQPSSRVRWGAELDAASLSESYGGLEACLQGVRSLTLNLSIGIEVDDRDRPKFGAEPRIEEIDLFADDDELIRMSRRPVPGDEDASSGRFRVDRMATEHTVFAEPILQALSVPALADLSADEANKLLAAATGVLVSSLVVQHDTFLPRNLRVSVEEVQLLRMAKPPHLVALEETLPSLLQELLNAVGESIEKRVGALRYLGPLRSLPPRNVVPTQQGDLDRVAGGAWAWDELRQVEPIRDAVNAWLGSERLNTPYELQVRSLVSVDRVAQAIEDVLADVQYEAGEALSDGFPASHGVVDAAAGDTDDHPDASSDLAARLAQVVTDPRLERFRELVLLDKRRNVIVTHRDVGVGISQVLPVLVMCYSSVGQMVAIEQPEIHLHPALQSELGDVFIDAALSGRRNTMLIETHSEHLLLRIQRRIREDLQGATAGRPRITADDVAVLYVEPHEKRSVVREMPLTVAGELAKAWPGGFFEEGLREQLDA